MIKVYYTKERRGTATFAKMDKTDYDLITDVLIRFACACEDHAFLAYLNTPDRKMPKSANNMKSHKSQFEVLMGMLAKTRKDDQYEYRDFTVQQLGYFNDICKEHGVDFLYIEGSKPDPRHAAMHRLFK